MNEFILIGKITGTHGIKGELKIISDFEKKNLVFQKGFKIYLEDKEFNITSYRVHKNFDMITINSLNDINEVIKYVGLNVFVKRMDLNLKENDYLLNDLINFDVYDEDIHLGIVNSIYKSPKYNYLLVAGLKEFYIPLIDEYILKIDLIGKKIYTKHGEDLIL